MTNQLLHTAKHLLLGFLAAWTFASCDPCDGVVCDNGTCSNGTCICEPGYERKLTACLPINKRYVPTQDTTITASLLVVDNNTGSSSSFSNIGYTFTTEDGKPFEFVLKRFDFISDNDILFQINPQKYAVLSGGTVTTGAGRTYEYSGGKAGNQVQLQITDTQQQKTYTITYQL